MINRIGCTLFAFAIGGLWVSPPTAASSDSQKIDGPHSTVTVRVYKSGFLSAFGHNHEIQAPIQSGEVKEADNPSVELRVDARKLRVLDPEVSEATRAQVQDTMQGSQVLDVVQFPEIRFQSTGIEGKGPDHWIVHGNLALHGRDRSIAVAVTLKAEHYRGSATLKQTDFGITPVTVAGGTVKVKDEVKIEFEIALIK
jgi:polyisoprenoid-binding protein YceI